MFGDDDPEDAWDPGDSLREHVDLIDRWVHSVQLERLTEGATARLILRKEMALHTIDELLLHVVPPPFGQRLLVAHDRLELLP